MRSAVGSLSWLRDEQVHSTQSRATVGDLVMCNKLLLEDLKAEDEAHASKFEAAEFVSFTDASHAAV